MARHGHYCTGAIAHQYEIGGEYGNRFPGDWVDGVDTEPVALFLHGLDVSFGGAAPAAFLDEGIQCLVFCGGLEC